MSSENETLLLAVLSQLTVTKLDFALLATSIGSPTPGAAAKRWQRFQKKLKDSSSASSSPGTLPGKGKKPVGVKRMSGVGKFGGGGGRKGKKIVRGGAGNGSISVEGEAEEVLVIGSARVEKGVAYDDETEISGDY